jgi:hypothetical protein
LEWVSLAHKALGEGIDLHLSLLAGPSADVRQTTAHTLAAFPEYVKRIVPPLLNAARREAESKRGGILPLALGALLNGSPEAAWLVEGQFGELSDERKRLACAAALATILRDLMSDAAIETLVEAFAQTAPVLIQRSPIVPSLK